MDQKLRQNIDRFVAENETRIFEDIARLIAIDSVEAEEKPGMPFGEGPAKALQEALKIAQELGLDAVNCENYIGYAQLGEGEDIWRPSPISTSFRWARAGKRIPSPCASARAISSGAASWTTRGRAYCACMRSSI